MKVAIVLCLAVACALAKPVDESAAEITAYSNEAQPDGNYVFNYETSNGISRSEQGQLRDGRDEKNNAISFLVKSGEYSWTDGAGQKHTLTYTADENGFRVEGDDVPKNQ